MSYSVNIISQIWKKDSCRIFDYESNEIKESKLRLKKDCALFLNDEVIKIVNKLDNYTNKGKHKEYVATFLKGSPKNSFNIKFEKNNEDMNSIWLVLRHTHLNSGYKLNVDDILKMGKVKFRINEINYEDLQNEENINTCLLRENDQLKLNNLMTIYRTNEDERILTNLNKFENIVERKENIDKIGNFSPENEFENERANSENNDIFDHYINLNRTYSNFPNILSNSNRTQIKQDFPTLDNNQNVFNNYSYSDHMNIDDTIFNGSFSRNYQNCVDLNELKLGDYKHPNLLILNKSNKVNIPQNTQEGALKNLCRICLNDGSEEHLISVCKCTGSVKYIHFKCLQKWVISKILIKYNCNLVAYSYEIFKCELCKTDIPNKIKINHKLHNLIDTKKVFEQIKFEPSIVKVFGNNIENTKYISLELLVDEHNHPNVNKLSDKKFIYIFCMGNRETLKIGRSTNSEIRLSDYSISRNHAIIHANDKGIFLTDLNSKFGSHIKLDKNKEINLLPYKKLSVQTGRVFLQVCLIKSYNCFSCISGKKIKKDSSNDNIDYNNLITQNDKILDAKYFIDSNRSVEEIVKIAEVEEIRRIPFEAIYDKSIKIYDHMQYLNSQNLAKRIYNSQKEILNINRHLKIKGIRSISQEVVKDMSYDINNQDKSNQNKISKIKKIKSDPYNKNILINDKFNSNKTNSSNRVISLRTKNINNIMENVQ